MRKSDLRTDHVSSRTDVSLAEIGDLVQVIVNLVQPSNVLERCHSYERVRVASSMQGATLIAFHEVVQKLGYWVHSGNQQVISGASTSNVE